MDNRKPLIAGNWKMHKTSDESVQTAKRLAELVDNTVDVDVMIAPQFTALESVAKRIEGSPISLGAQNVYWESQGAFTGEVSAPMLAAVGCTYVIIGHSERRQLFMETDDHINKKIKAVIQSDLVPILCIGETEEEREAEKTFFVLDKQLNNGLKGFVPDELKKLVIAYEPVWAIGTGKTATVEQAQQAHHFIRSLVEKNFGSPLASAMRILYGGSVKPSNIKQLMEMDDLDGALVGGASLDAESFSQIIRYNG